MYFFCFISAVCLADGCECYISDRVYPIVKLCNNLRSQASHDVETGIFFYLLDEINFPLSTKVTSEAINGVSLI